MSVHNTNNPGQRGAFEAQPVAFDVDGNPLYAQAQFVHLSRPLDPKEPEIPPEILKRHQISRRIHPQLNLTQGEYVIMAVRRHPIGIFQIWAIGIVFILALMTVYFLTFIGPGASSQLQEFSSMGAALLGLMLVLVTLGVMVATYVYRANRFYLTNESVIQEIQTSLFSRNEQTVSLSNIEDASYTQGGILSLMFNYGTIRLSTEGDETTYRFSYVSNPRHHIAVLNNAVEAFKNGRPIYDGDPTDD